MLYLSRGSFDPIASITSLHYKAYRLDLPTSHRSWDQISSAVYVSLRTYTQSRSHVNRVCDKVAVAIASFSCRKEICATVEVRVSLFGTPLTVARLAFVTSTCSARLKRFRIVVVRSVRRLLPSTTDWRKLGSSNRMRRRRHPAFNCYLSRLLEQQKPWPLMYHMS